MIIKQYYALTKPGIIYGNLVPAIAGFFLASRGQIDLLLLISMILGTSFIIGSGCVFNNYIDSGIDKKMARTKNRALVTGIISGKHALIYGTILGIAGIVILYCYTNLLTMFVGIIGLFVYVILYGISKRRSSLSTIIGSIAGATPPIAGYCAVTNRFDLGALLLFLLLVFWQMPHFYAIALYRLEDYRAASLPILPVIRGIPVTKLQMLFYIIAFVVISLLFTVTGYTGYLYCIVAVALGMIWIGISIHGLKMQAYQGWARKNFFYSLLVIILLSIMLAVDVKM